MLFSHPSFSRQAARQPGPCRHLNSNPVTLMQSLAHLVTVNSTAYYLWDNRGKVDRVSEKIAQVEHFWIQLYVLNNISYFQRYFNSYSFLKILKIIFYLIFSSLISVTKLKTKLSYVVALSTFCILLYRPLIVSLPCSSR